VVDKKQIRRNLKQLQRIKTWQLVILLILASFVAATFLRLNNIGMIERRAAVVVADKEGDEAVIKSRLYKLQLYVSSHMNTDMGKGVGLEASYNRDKQALMASLAEASNSSNIYKIARNVCDPKFNSKSYIYSSYLACINNELAKYPSGQNINNQVKLSTEPYTHVYLSPLWSSDFAGWSVLICVVIFIIILSRLTAVIILRILLHMRYKNI
jgi:hypothetical protein